MTDNVGERGPMDITELLAYTRKNGASDLHLSSGNPPMVRISGEIRPIEAEPLDRESVRSRPPGGVKFIAFAMFLREMLCTFRASAGFTLLELTIVIVVLGLLLVPLLWLTTMSVGTTREQATSEALATARDALVAFAAGNNGCLPFAADYEGGYPDTDATGASGGYVDTGVGRANIRAGDLPWADLGLSSSFVEGDGWRIQYYVATLYTDVDANPTNGIACLAGFRGFEWNSSVTYDGASSRLYVYYTVGGNRDMYEIISNYPAGTTPDAIGVSVAKPVGTPLPAQLLDLKRGPDVAAASPQNDVISSPNVFVLVAPGGNTNAVVGRPYVRDSNHARDAAGTDWPLAVIDANVDGVVFSNTPDVDVTNAGNNGDDTLLAMSFLEFKSALALFALNMEEICDDGGEICTIYTCSYAC